MRFEEDEVLHTCFNRELEKIPRFLRCGKKKLRFFMVLCGTWFIINLFIAALPRGDAEVVWIRAPGINYPFALPPETLKYTLITNIFLFFILLWLETCDLLERRAYRRATDEAQRISQHNKEIERWADMKEKAKLEKVMREFEIEEKSFKSGPVFCKKCGLLMPDDTDDNKCPTCGTIND